MIALDASALLALFFREPGHRMVEASIPESCMSTVNFCEVLDRMARDGHSIEAVRERVTQLEVEFVPFAESQAEVAAAIAPIVRVFGMSLADRACIAMADQRRIPVLTADRVWATVDLGVEVRLIR